MHPDPSVEIIGNAILQQALDINLALSDLAVFNKSADDDDTVGDNPPGGGGNECGPGGPGGGEDSLLRNIVKNWRDIVVALLLWDSDPEAGTQSSRAHTRHLETIAKIEEAQRRTRRDEEEQDDDDKNC